MIRNDCLNILHVLQIRFVRKIPRKKTGFRICNLLETEIKLRFVLNIISRFASEPCWASMNCSNVWCYWSRAAWMANFRGRLQFFIGPFCGLWLHGLDNAAKAFKAYRESVEDRIAQGSAFQDTSWLNADWSPERKNKGSRRLQDSYSNIG